MGAIAARLEIRGLTVRYGAVIAVLEVDLDVPAAGLTALVGPSGCGKTSLLRAIAGFEPVAAGEVRIDGRLVAGSGASLPPEKRRIGMVFQEGALFPHLTVWRNVLYGLKGEPERHEKAQAALELVGLADHRGRFPDELSGGEQQRIALARALAPGPRLVLLDEPFANLDASLRRRVREDVRGILARAGATAILVTHDQEEALSVAETVAVMIDGRVHQVGQPAEVYHRPASLAVARFIGEGQLLECTVDAGEARTALGTVPCSGAEGRGLLLVRPEDVELCTSDGVAGRVLARSFYGHDLVDEVELEGGSRLDVRVLSPSPVEVGAAVAVRLRPKTYRAFPAEPGDATAGALSGVSAAAAPTS